MIDLFDDGVEVFIKIKLDSLFDYLREQGFKIYPKKQIPFPYLFTYKNKMWMIDYKECGPAGAGAFTVDTLKRIFCGMYTSQGLADYLKTECRDLEQGVRALLQEVESQ